MQGLAVDWSCYVCDTLQRTATCCNTLQHTATHIQGLAVDWSCHVTLTLLPDTLQHTATHCNTLQHTATHCNTHTGARGRLELTDSLQHVATHCNTLQHTYRGSRRTGVAMWRLPCCQTLQHTATHCNTLQHTATHCNTHTGARSRLELPCDVYPVDSQPCNKRSHRKSNLFQTLQPRSTQVIYRYYVHMHRRINDYRAFCNPDFPVNSPYISKTHSFPRAHVIIIYI